MTPSKSATDNLEHQYRRPFGMVGRRIGREMARGHLSENLWTVARLNPEQADHILEIGFGPGVAIEELSKRVTSGLIAGVDCSETMVREAGKRNAHAIQAGLVELHCGDVTALPFDDASFDKAYSIHSIYFWSEPLKALKELQRVLKPNGTLLITMLPKDKWPANPPGSSFEYGTPECVPYFGREIEEMMIAAGFRLTHVEADSSSTDKSNFSVFGTK
jgi:ubiquinone/menaquinone biosynthesis C-methylase UbiE